MGIERIATLIATKQKKIQSNSNRVVIYTRVSTHKQIDNTSLESQLEKSREYCIKHNYTIVREFGGTNESAKSDEDRKQFSEMIKFVRSQKNDIRHIISFSPDRFSRTGGSAIDLVDQLRSLHGVSLKFVNQDFDDSTPLGRFIRSLSFLTSQLDNEVRKGKVVDGMTATLKQGYFPFGSPIGYTKSDRPSLKVPDETRAPFIKMAFELKAQNYSHDQIVERLKSQGFKIGLKRLSDIFQNPFYCGLIHSTLLNGEMVKGQHQPLISEELFERVNGAKICYTKHEVSKSEPYPLKGFLKCNVCNKKWTAYIAVKKKINYYKCNTPGCKGNRSAKMLHEDFATHLRQYVIPTTLIEPLKNQLRLAFKEKNQIKFEERAVLLKRLKDVQESIETAKYRHGVGKIEKDIYLSTVSKLHADERGIRKLLDEADIYLSNPKSFIDFSLGLCQNIDQAWVSGDTRLKHLLQGVIFPEGIIYDHPTNTYRTTKVNGMFTLFNSISNTYKRKEEEQTCHSSSNSGWVVPTGIEPVSKV